MANIGSLVWKIEADTKSIDKGLKDTDAKVSKFGATVKGAFTVAAVTAFAAAIVKAGEVAFEFASAAGDLAESQNAVSVVFEDSADTILSFAETAVESVGLTQTAFNELSTTIGAQLKQSGQEIDIVADKTIELTQRAADTASIFNVEVNEALEAFGAALRGEAEPARRFGVNISDAAVQAEALASGLVESKNEITDQIKVQARYNLILQQSNDYAGDFANTQDSFSNQVKIAKANIDELRVAIGEGLIPVTGAAITKFNEWITGFIELKKQANELKEAFAAQREGTQTLDQELAILLNRQERYTNLTRRQKEELQAEIDTLRELIAMRDASANQMSAAGARAATAAAVTERQATANRDVVSSTEEIVDARVAAAEAALLDNEARTAQLRAEAELEIENQAREREAQAQLEEFYAYREELAQREIELEQQRHDERIANLIAEAEQYVSYADSVVGIFESLDDLFAAQNDAELQRLEERIEATEEGSDERIAAEEEYDQRKKELEYEEAKRSKNLRIFQAIINTASAIVGFLADPGGYPGIILSALAGVTGALNIAAIAAEPLPSLQDGGIVPATPGGQTVRVAEAGQAEAIVPLDDDVGIGGNYTFILQIDGATIAENTVSRINAGQYTIMLDRGTA